MGWALFGESMWVEALEWWVSGLVLDGPPLPLLVHRHIPRLLYLQRSISGTLPGQPVGRLKTASRDRADEHYRKAAAAGRHRRSHLPVRLADECPDGLWTPVQQTWTRESRRGLALDRRHTALPFGHGGRTPARTGRGLRPGVGQRL